MGSSGADENKLSRKAVLATVSRYRPGKLYESKMSRLEAGPEAVMSIQISGADEIKLSREAVLATVSRYRSEKLCEHVGQFRRWQQRVATRMGPAQRRVRQRQWTTILLVRLLQLRMPRITLLVRQCVMTLAAKKFHSRDVRLAVL